MHKRLLLGLLLAVGLVTAGCGLWDTPPVRPTPQPTPTPPKVEDAGYSSPSVQGRILYARDGNIWLRSGTSAQRLTEGMWATQPAWSPDYRQIAFVVKGEGYSDVWVMDADGRSQHPLTDNRSSALEGTKSYVQSSYWAFQPQWLPSGESIGFISHGPTQKATTTLTVYVISRDGATEQRYLNPQEGQVEMPSWTPGEEIMVYTLFTYVHGAQLRYLDVNVNFIATLGRDIEGIERYDPALSPDGQWVMYVARQGGKSDLWVMPSPLNPLYTTEWSPVRLTNKGTARGPAWSPDGQRVVFIAEENDSFDLWLLNLELVPEQIPQPAGGALKLTNGAHVDAASHPSWAP